MSTTDCPICLSSITSQRWGVVSPCGHPYHFGCWNEYDANHAAGSFGPAAGFLGRSATPTCAYCNGVAEKFVPVFVDLNSASAARPEDIDGENVGESNSVSKSHKLWKWGCIGVFTLLLIGSLCFWSNGLINASIVTFPNCDTYKDGKYHGWGICKERDGHIYMGEFQDNLKHGKGKYKSAFGSVYVGQFNHGRWHGDGTFKSANGDLYEGGFENGMRCGKGTYKWPRGDVYEGDWKNNESHGYGTAKYSNGDVYVGQFQDSLKHGKGTYKSASGTVYEGDWKNNKRHGYSTCKYPNGDVYVGQFQDNLKHGKGTYKWASGSVYKGDWKNGMYSL